MTVQVSLTELTQSFALLGLFHLFESAEVDDRFLLYQFFEPALSLGDLCGLLDALLDALEF
jgi:hypothetical protein